MNNNRKHEKNIKSKNEVHIVSDYYFFIKKIGSGSFGEVFLAECNNGSNVAAKVEERNKSSKILNEYRIYNYLHKNNFNTGLPKVYDFMQTQDNNILFMQLLGPNLEDIFIKNSKEFTTSTVFMLANQLIILLKQLHNAEYIHRDIKPSNFLIGKNDNKGQIFIMDFGLSKKYTINGKHIKFKDNKSLIGTARYASRNVHLGFEPSRRDDLESVGYMLIYFLKGKLPWQNLKKKKGVKHLDTIGEKKMCISLESLCENVPQCFIKYLSYCRKLKFNEVPDYEYLSHLFIDFCSKNNIKACYQWNN